MNLFTSVSPLAAVDIDPGIVSEPSSVMSQAKTKANVTSACQDAVKDEWPALSFSGLIQEALSSARSKALSLSLIT